MIPLFRQWLGRFLKVIAAILDTHITVGSLLESAEDHTVIFFPYQRNVLACGLAALVAYKGKARGAVGFDGGQLQGLVSSMAAGTLGGCLAQGRSVQEHYLGGDRTLGAVLGQVRQFRTEGLFGDLVGDEAKQQALGGVLSGVKTLVSREEDQLGLKVAEMDAGSAEVVFGRLETLKDIAWCLEREVLENLVRVQGFAGGCNGTGTGLFKKINSVLNSIDRLEVRGRDSAGISILFVLEEAEYQRFREALAVSGLMDQLKQRSNRKVLVNNTITRGVCSVGDATCVSLSFVYKCAAEIGSLGDNVHFLRNQIRNDQVLRLLAGFSVVHDSVSAHTRWASVGAISEANCHPVDNEPNDAGVAKSGIIHVSLNGDIDNYQELKAEHEYLYDVIHGDITTDTKIIPLQIEHYLKQGHGIDEAFRLAVGDFKGSHAISMHTDLAPGKVFLAQKGSGQTVFVGIGPDHYMAASEVYGLVEETQSFVKLNGEEAGQIMVLDGKGEGGVGGLTSMAYDGTEIRIGEEDVQQTEITSRDIDRQDFPHYFLKEISEAPGSVEKTLLNRWKRDEQGLCRTVLDGSVMPEALVEGLRKGVIRHVYFIGQGTAGVAAQGCAHVLNTYLGGAGLDIRAMKSSELSGFFLGDANGGSMKSYLVVAISQSGTTTDTNRTVDMVRARGARTLAIVNRRDSDLTFKVDGVLYTSTGRDIEMSVASTKAFYSQLTAGALLGLHIAQVTGQMAPEAVSREIDALMGLPGKMSLVLAMKEAIRASARAHAVAKNYWATVGSGANKTSADEIRIKLSELCYKTISSDFVEDKKHIDLSAEPLIIVCAAGTRESVLGDIIKDTAIFSAHKAVPVVIVHEGENRFDTIARDVFKVPRVSEHLAPVLNTLVGHLWGYYAALAMNEGSEFLFRFRKELEELLEEYESRGMDLYEVVLEKEFREVIASFYTRFSRRRRDRQLPACIGLDAAASITLLLKYLAGRLPVSDFEVDFEVKGTPANMLDLLFRALGDAVNIMARPVDAIKHQAKTVTVGTSRLSEVFEGIVFDELANHGFSVDQVSNRNVLVIKNLQEVISGVLGGLLYRVSGLTLLGEPGPGTAVEVVRKTGVLEHEESRVETDRQLKGTKHIIVREGNVYIGRGRKDGKSFLVIPMLPVKVSASQAEGYLLSLNVAFKESGKVSLLQKIKALGGKYTRIKDVISEAGSLPWNDQCLNALPIEDLFGDSAEKIGDTLVAMSGMAGKGT